MSQQRNPLVTNYSEKTWNPVVGDILKDSDGNCVKVISIKPKKRGAEFDENSRDYELEDCEDNGVSPKADYNDRVYDYQRFYSFHEMQLGFDPDFRDLNTWNVWRESLVLKKRVCCMVECCL